MLSSKLAMCGGTPIRTKAFPKWPVFDQQEEEALLGVLHSGKWWQFGYGQGVELREAVAGENRAEVTKFQEEFASAHGCRYGIAAANGTGTLEIILRSLDIGPGDQVIVPPYTFIASATSTLQIGAVPIFVDIDPETYNLNPLLIEEAITPRTRAIMPVHFGGQSADMDAINALAKQHGLSVVEDAAHAHGSEWRHKRCGSLGDAGSFSFQASKNMTAGEGGCITTNNRELAQLCSSYLWAGREAGRPWYEHYRLGWNYRLGEFQGAILRVQLRRLEEQTTIRDANGQYLTDRLKEIPGITPVRRDDRANRVSYHLFMFRFSADAFNGMPRDQFLKALTAEGIPCSGGYVHPLYRNPMFLNKEFWKGGFPCVAPYSDVEYSGFAEKCPVSESACKTAVWLEHALLLGTREDMDDIVDAVAKVQECSG